MSERGPRFVRADGTLLDGEEAEQELAKHDAEKMLKDLKLDKAEKEKKVKDEEVFEGTGRPLKSSKGPRSSSTKANDPIGHSQSDHGPSGALWWRQPAPVGSSLSISTDEGDMGTRAQARHASVSYRPGVSSSREETGIRRESKARAEAEDKEMKEKIKSVSSQMEKDSNEIWKFSKDAEQTVYYFSLDVDTLWNKVFSIMDTVQRKINETGSRVSAVLDQASGQTDSTISMLEKWGDMSKNIKDGSELLKNKVKDKTSDVTGFAKNLNDKAQKLAKSASANLSNPLLQNVADMSGVSDTLTEMAGTGQYITDSFTTIVESQSKNLQMKITEASERITALGKSSGLFGFIKDLAGELSHHLSELSKLIKQIREKVGGLLNKINGLFDMIYTGLAKLSSIIEGVLGLDMALMKEALKNGTIRPTDVRVGRVAYHLQTEVSTKSSTEITGAKVTAGNVSASGVVKDNSKSGHIEAAVVDVKAANVDVAFKRKGKVKRNLAYLKGADVNVGNVRATAIDDREVELAVVGASAAEVNVGNVVVEGLGKKGTHKHTTAQPSLTVGNVAVGVRRSTGTNIRAGPKLSAFNVDLTVGVPTVTNFLNQLGPGQAFGNIAIPFLGGGGGGETGGKSSGPEGNGGGGGTTCEPEGDAGFSSARDFAVYGRPGDDDGMIMANGDRDHCTPSTDKETQRNTQYVQPIGSSGNADSSLNNPTNGEGGGQSYSTTGTTMSLGSCVTQSAGRHNDEQGRLGTSTGQARGGTQEGTLPRRMTDNGKGEIDSSDFKENQCNRNGLDSGAFKKVDAASSRNSLGSGVYKKGVAASSRNGLGPDVNKKGDAAISRNGLGSGVYKKGDAASNRNGLGSDVNKKGDAALSRNGLGSGVYKKGDAASNRNGLGSDVNKKGDAASSRNGVGSGVYKKGDAAREKT